MVPVFIADLELLVLTLLMGVRASFPLLVMTSVLVVFSDLELETTDSVLVTVCEGAGLVGEGAGEERL